MSIIANVLLLLLEIYSLIVIVQVIVFWLLRYEVMNIENPQTRNLVDLLDRLTAPVYTPLRKYIPPIGGVDITPMVVIVIILILEALIRHLAWGVPL